MSHYACSLCRFWPVNCIFWPIETLDWLFCHYHSIGINSRFTQQCNVVFYVYADLCSLLAANCQFSILIGQKKQLTGCHNGNEMRNETCADTKISIEWPYCSFLYCAIILASQLHKNRRACCTAEWPYCLFPIPCHWIKIPSHYLIRTVSSQPKVVLIILSLQL